MKKLSAWSIILMVIGLLLFGVNWMMDGYIEPIVLIGFIFSLLGVVFSFIAIAKREVGTLKFVSIFSFFVVMLLVIWFEPAQFLLMVTWVKNLF